jgi:hypothetical protein
MQALVKQSAQRSVQVIDRQHGSAPNIPSVIAKVGPIADADHGTQGLGEDLCYLEISLGV